MFSVNSTRDKELYITMKEDELSNSRKDWQPGNDYLLRGELVDLEGVAPSR
jgi:hypothetical protein